MKALILILATGLCVCNPYSAECRRLQSIPMVTERNLITSMESSDRQHIEFQYRTYLSDSPTKVDVIEMDVEKCAAAAEAGKTSYNIKVCYVDSTAEGCSDTLLQIALCGATLAQKLKDSEIGTIIAIPVFARSEGIQKRQERAMVLINCCPYEGKGLFSRIADGRLKRDDIIEMSSWMQKWDWRRLDPNFALTMQFN